MGFYRSVYGFGSCTLGTTTIGAVPLPCSDVAFCMARGGEFSSNNKSSIADPTFNCLFCTASVAVVLVVVVPTAVLVLVASSDDAGELYAAVPASAISD